MICQPQLGNYYGDYDMGKKNYYGVYRKATDEIVAFGNAEQCAQKLGLKNARQFYAFVSKTRSGIRKKYEVIVDDDPWSEETDGDRAYD